MMTIRVTASCLALALAGCGNGADAALSRSDGGGEASTGGTAASTGGRSGAGGTSGAGGESRDAEAPDAEPGDAGAGGSGLADAEAGDAEAGARTVVLTTYVGLAQANLPFVASQDGDGPWRVLAGGGGRYTLQVTGERYSFVVVCAGFPTVQTFNVTVSEWPEPVAGCTGEPILHDVSGVVTGLGASERARVNLRYGSTDVVSPESAYSMRVPEGTWDAIVTRGDGSRVTHLLIERDVLVFGPVVDLGFDFAGGGIVPVSHTLAVNGLLPGEVLSAAASFTSHRGTSAYLPSPVGTVSFVPASELTGNDTHSISAFGVDEGAGTLRFAGVSRRLPGDVTLALPPLFDADVWVAATSPQVRFGFEFDVTPGALVYHGLFSQVLPSPSDRNVTWWSRISAGWLGTVSRGTYTFPDFSELTGWSPSDAPRVGTETRWEVTAIGDSDGLEDALFAHATRATPLPPVDGATRHRVERTGQIIP